MTIKTACVYDSALPEEEGMRVLITRYWPRGVKRGRVDLWIRGLGPSAGLIKSWKSGRISWEEFRQSYLDEFSIDEKKEALARLRVAMAGRDKATLLCACKVASNCHRSIVEVMLKGEVM